MAVAQTLHPALQSAASWREASPQEQLVPSALLSTPSIQRVYIQRYSHPQTHTHTLVPTKLKKNQYIQCIKRMNVLKNAQNPLYFHTSEMLDRLHAWFSLLLSIRFIRPGLELRGDGYRSHGLQHSSHSVPAAQGTGTEQEEGFLPRILCNCVSLSHGFGAASVRMLRNQTGSQS